MKHHIAAFSLFVLACPFNAAAQQPPPSLPLAVAGVTVIDVRDGSRTRHATIVIDAGRITAVGASALLRIPPGARVLNARGKYVIPGLWDLHTHIQNQRDLDVFFPLLVAHGILGIRDTGGLLPREFRELGKRHQYVPHVVACGTAVDGPAPAGVADAAIVDSLADQGVDYIKVLSMLPRERFLAIVARAKQRGLHVAGHVPIAVTAAEASDAGLRTMEHLDEILLNISSRETELRAARLAALSGRTTFVDQVLIQAFPPIEPFLSDWSDAKASALFKKFVANHTWQTPTLELYRVWGAALGDDPLFWKNPNLAFMPKDWRDSWRPERSQFLSGVPPSERPGVILRMKAWYRSQLDVVLRMHAAGVGFLAGTDVSQWNFMVPGASLHDELARFVEAGLSPLEALQTATINPAQYLGITDSAGTIAPGKRADFLVLDSDPTVNIANAKRISAVVLGGRLLDRTELNRMFDSARQRAATEATP